MLFVPNGTCRQTGPSQVHLPRRQPAKGAQGKDGEDPRPSWEARDLQVGGGGERAHRELRKDVWPPHSHPDPCTGFHETPEVTRKDTPAHCLQAWDETV
jgi:hypothetical protein